MMLKKIRWINFISFCILLWWSVGVFQGQVQAEEMTTVQEELTSTSAIPFTENQGETPIVKKQKLKKLRVKVKEKEMVSFFKKSAFIGSSIGVGQKMYLDYEGNKYMNHSKMLVRGSYSFINDQVTGSQFRLTYQGENCAAKDAVAKAKVKYLFINMGTNDMWETPKKVFRRYKEYIKGIRKKNPGIVIFIESTTPVYSSAQKSGLNNKNINKLNLMMKKYCEKSKDLYFIDVSSALKDSSGGLAAQYCSDKYVHITMSGYRVWTKKVCSYVRKLLEQEKRAKTAVKYAKKRKIKIEYERANKLVSKLERSTVKSNLIKQLKGIKYD